MFDCLTYKQMAIFQKR